MYLESIHGVQWMTRISNSRIKLKPLKMSQFTVKFAFNIHIYNLIKYDY